MELIFDKNAKENKKRDEEMIKENKRRDEESKKREDQMMKQFQAMTNVSSESKPEGKADAVSSEGYRPYTPYTPYRGRGGATRGRGGFTPEGRRICYNCQGTDGHIARDCTAPKKERQAPKPVTEEAKVNEVQVNKTVIIPKMENYMEIQTRSGTKITALVDTGCQFTCGPSKYFTHDTLSACETALITAGKIALKVKGCTYFTFTIGDQTITTEVIVSDDLDELLIGANTLTENKSVWDINSGMLTMNDVPIKLKTRQCKCNVRRIYIKETTVIPGNHVALVPVEIRVVNGYAEDSDWLLKNRKIRDGVYAARAILSKDSVAVQVINLSDEEQKISGGISLGNAYATKVVDDFEQVQSEQSGPDAAFIAVINSTQECQTQGQNTLSTTQTVQKHNSIEAVRLGNNEKSSLTREVEQNPVESRPGNRSLTVVGSDRNRRRQCYSCLTRSNDDSSDCACGISVEEGRLTRRFDMMESTGRFFQSSRDKETIGLRI